MFKQKFLAKMNFLNMQGDNIDFINRVETWIEDNLSLLQKGKNSNLRSKSVPSDKEFVDKLMKFVEKKARSKSFHKKKRYYEKLKENCKL